MTKDEHLEFGKDIIRMMETLSKKHGLDIQHGAVAPIVGALLRAAYAVAKSGDMNVNAVFATLPPDAPMVQTGVLLDTGEAMEIKEWDDEDDAPSAEQPAVH